MNPLVFAAIILLLFAASAFTEPPAPAEATPAPPPPPALTTQQDGMEVDSTLLLSRTTHAGLSVSHGMISSAD